MDTFFEQIVPIRKTLKDAILLFVMWLAAGIIATVVFLLSLGLRLMPIGFLLAVLIFYGTYRLSQNFFIEFEYIVTNNVLDIDKIIAKSRRKRIASIEIPSISEIKKFNPAAVQKVENQTRIYACNPRDEKAFEITASKDQKTVKIVLAPNDRIKEGIIKCLPRYIANSAFKGDSPI